jgi:hypothetical protein
LRAGVDHYDGSSTSPVSIVHGSVGVSQTAWLGPPGGGPPPVDTQPPSVPAGVTASAVGQSSISVTWSASTDNVGVSGYHVYRDGGASPVATVSSPGYTDTGLAPGSTHSYTVDAFDAVPNVSAKSASASATTSTASSVPPGFDSVSTDPGCGGCSVSTTAAGELQAVVAGAADGVDTAVGIRDFGGSGGLSGRVFTRDVLRLAAGQLLSDNLAVFQVLDAGGGLVYELYLDSSRTIELWSPPGGLRASSVNLSTGVVVPNDGSSSVRVEVSALANSSLVVRVNDVDKITLTGLSGASSGNQRFLRAGVDHYDGSSTSPVSIVHGSVGVSQTTWLGAP